MSGATATVMRIEVVGVAFMILTGCRDPREAAPECTEEPKPPTASPFKKYDETTVPTGPLGDAIKRGRTIVTRTYEELPDHAGNQLHCSSCHLDGGTVANAGPWIGLPGVFPEYRARSGRVDTLANRINDCFERSLNGVALDPRSEDMAAIQAYMSFLSRGVESGAALAGRGFKRVEPPPVPDPVHGEQVYQKTCIACHGPDGAGVQNKGAYVYPPLWGDHAFNIGAGMARLDTAAAFVRHNMPLGAGGTLSDQDAYDVAAFVIAKPRPDFARKSQDWPKGGKPRDARY